MFKIFFKHNITEIFPEKNQNNFKRQYPAKCMSFDQENMVQTQLCWSNFSKKAVCVELISFLTKILL